MSDLDPAAYVDEAGEPRPGAPLGMLLWAYAQLDPERPALTAGGETLTRAELEAAACRRARQLAALGVDQDDRVVVALPNGREFYETVLAAWKLGATPAHVSYRLTAPEFAALLELGQPKLVVGLASAAAAAAALGAAFLADGARPDPALSAEPLEPRAAAAWKISTSGGSTGRPKLVVDPNPGVWGEEKAALRRVAGATIINPGPLYHSAPFGQMIPALCQGGHVIDMPRFDAEEWLRLVDRHRADWAYLVPTMMARIARLPLSVRGRYDISSIRTLVHMAAPCPEWVKAFWIEYIGADAVWEIYGGA
ncbi:MAG TPA: AMP-binding protein, partial [Phenylobacterium sp.]|nr:AMP-binding protein [Phenylobacterium sp.]